MIGVAGLLVALLVAIGAAAQAAPAQQCGVVYGPDYCELSSCYITVVNSTCGAGEYSELLEPVCDERYFASFVVMLGDSMFTLYESPEAEANGYASYKDALEWSQSVGALVPCIVANTTAYVYTPTKGKSGGDDSEFGGVILGLVIAAIVIFCLIVITLTVIAVTVYAAKVLKSRKAQVVV